MYPSGRRFGIDIIEFEAAVIAILDWVSEAVEAEVSSEIIA